MHIYLLSSVALPMSPTGRLAAVVWWVAAFTTFLPQRATGELVLLTTLTRHGSRAPNVVIDSLCPNNEANRAAYHVPPGQLTENGMKQAYKLGVFLRETYVEALRFLPATLGTSNQSHFSAKFTSAAAERCLMTAQAMAQGLYPNGTGPPGFPNQPVAVQTNQLSLDNLLSAPHAACKSLQEADNKVFDESRGAELIHEQKRLVDTVAKACGTAVESYASVDSGHGKKEGLILGVKDVSDMINFDDQQGLTSLPAITAQVREDMTALAFQLLQERYYSTLQKVTYWAGELPHQLLKDFYAASEQHANGEPPARLYLGYHGHRELLYGLAHLLGWKFDVEGMPLALGTSAIPPGTTMFFELHYHAAEKGDSSQPASIGDDYTVKENSGGGGGGGGGRGYYYVRTFAWTPDYGQQEVVLESCKGVEAGRGCPLSSLKEIVDKTIADVGKWQEICQFVPFAQAEQLAQDVVFNGRGGGEDSVSAEPATSVASALSVIAVIAVAAVVFWLGALLGKNKWLAVREGGGREGEMYERVP